MRGRKGNHYLARKGKTFGPFSEQEFEKLNRSGEIDTFTWIWNEKLNQWKPLDPAPVPLNLSTRRPSLSKSSKNQTWEAICHDFRRILSGKLKNLTETGCELCVVDSHTSSPSLPLENNIVMNLLNSTSGKSMNINVRLTNATKSGSLWIYRVRWDAYPVGLE